MEFKRIVILAKSYKPGGWCIAGKEIQYKNGRIQSVNGWVRPVSGDAENHGSLSDRDCSLNCEGIVEVYDIVDVPIIDHVAEPGQPENYRIVDGVAWKKIDYVAPGEIRQLEETPDDIWLEGDLSTNQVSSGYDESGKIIQSLYLVKPEEFKIKLSNDLNVFTGRHKRDARASFLYNGVEYKNISITDPKIRHAFSDKYPEPDGLHVEQRLVMGDKCLICISLGPRFTGKQRHYKLVATVHDYTGYYQKNFR